MNKELKALEKINHTICLAFNDNNKALFNKDSETHIDCKDIYEFCDCYEIIETALKDYQTLKREYDFGVEHYNELLNKYNKEHKALELIREKGTLFFVDDEGNPNTTEEERKILKEVLE